MVWKLTKCRRTTTRRVPKPCSSSSRGRGRGRHGVDRLTSLPGELLSKIVSMLSTKEVGAIQLVSKTMCTLAFKCLTSLDFDWSPVSLCTFRPNLVHHFPLFQSFVDNALRKSQSAGNKLTRYRLCVGGDITNNLAAVVHVCQGDCLPDMLPSRLNAWISYPLTHSALKELDLSFHVMRPSSYHLPSGLFTCQLLEVLKLDSNLNLTAADFSLISLPNLRLLHLKSLTILEDDFVATLVSTCPSLEDLDIRCLWSQCDHVAICSHSLRRLVLCTFNCHEEKTTDFVIIDAPNVEYLVYSADLARFYSITNMNALIQAKVSLGHHWVCDSTLMTLEAQYSLVRMLSSVQHLSLEDHFVENMCYGSEFNCQLPVFDKLKTLELFCNNEFEERWDKVLLEFLNCSPCLETLVFPVGLFEIVRPNHNSPENLEIADLERRGWETTEATPQCLKSNLKRIVIKQYNGIARELNIIKFLLRKAAVLLELVVVHVSPPSFGVLADHILSESTLEALPRASIACSFRVS